MTHLLHHQPHVEQHLRSSAFISDIVIGMSDGLTVPFALAAGLSGAVASSSLVVTAGIAEIVAGSIAMGLGGYLAGRTEADHYESERRREIGEVETVPEREKEEVREVFAHMGLSPALQTIIADELANDKTKWVDFMMKYELGLDEPDPKRATKSAVTIGVSYVVGGLVPLSPYFILTNPNQALYYSCGVTLLCLFVFGYFKSKVTGQAPLTGAGKVTLIGALAAAAAFGVARFFTAQPTTYYFRMKPVRFFTDQQTVWYNLSDYIQLLMDTQTIYVQRPVSIHKRRGSTKSIESILREKINRLSPVYQQQRDGAVYIDWVIFEHLHRFIRPFLMHPDDWTNPESLFRQLHLVINRPKRSQLGVYSDAIASYFAELKDVSFPDESQAETRTSDS